MEQNRRVWAVLLKDNADSDTWPRAFCHQRAAAIESQWIVIQFKKARVGSSTNSSGWEHYIWSVLTARFLSGDKEKILCVFQFLLVIHFTFQFFHSNFDKFTVLQVINGLNQSMFNLIKKNKRGKSVPIWVHEIHLLTDPLFICSYVHLVHFSM